MSVWFETFGSLPIGTVFEFERQAREKRDLPRGPYRKVGRWSYVFACKECQARHDTGPWTINDCTPCYVEKRWKEDYGD